MSLTVFFVFIVFYCFLLQPTNVQIYITTVSFYIIYTPTCFDISIIIREFYICVLPTTVSFYIIYTPTCFDISVIIREFYICVLPSYINS